ncbi:MAG: hypothetical protein COV44_08810 [Deltaproteobacteria bacterium CG11_big_fil_rev_8_21_14_0_20_45_16]|nr:MAG: hypothetical protein COV44_08810 [Deltaproteobacteria bacterium CG11_big_fil_rev_8_21_14_0_20_45_16]
MQRLIKMSRTSSPADLSIDNEAQDGTPSVRASESAKRINADGLKHSVLLTSGIKTWWVQDLWSPVESFFVRRRVSPNAITCIGLALTFVAGFLIATNHLISGGWMVFIAASFDFLDGRVARATGKQSTAGAFFDSCMDRYMDAAVLMGMAFLFRDSWVLIFVLAAFMGSATTPYIRAKAESLGIKCSGGAMQRPERVLYLGTGTIISGYYECLRYPFEVADWNSAKIPLILAIGFVAFVSNKVAIERFLETFKELQSK